jgi:hypothetical protein
LCTQKYWLENEEELIPAVKGHGQSGGNVTGIQSVSCSSLCRWHRLSFLILPILLSSIKAA